MSSETTAQLQCMGKRGPFKVAPNSKPAIASDEVLIRQCVIALNALDSKQRDSGIFIEQWPHVLRIEDAGVIEAVGSDVSTLKPGDESRQYKQVRHMAKRGNIKAGVEASI